MGTRIWFGPLLLALISIAACCSAAPTQAASSDRAPAPVGAPAALGNDQSGIQLLGSLEGAATRVQVAGARAYVGGPSGLRIADVSDPGNLKLLGSLPIDVVDLRVVGDIAYVAGSSGLRIVDAADPAHPALRGSYDLPLADSTVSQTASRVDVAGGRAYVIFQQTIVGIPPYRGELAIIDVRDAAKPALLSRYDLGPSFSDLAVVGGYAYIGGTIDVGGATGRFFNAFLSILDLREPATPRPVGDYRGAELLFGGGVGTIAVNEVIVYLGITNGSALYTLDVHDPAHPALLGSLPISASDIRIEGQFAYLAGTPAGLMILDIRNPAALAARYVDDGSPTLRGVDVSGDLIYAASDVWLKAARFLPRTIALVPPGGATIETTVGRVTYTIPTGAFSDTVMLDHRLRPANDLPPAPGLARIGPAFEITASYTPTGEMMSPTLPITIMVGYTDVERGPAVANTLGLYYLDGGTWARASVSLLDPIARRVSVASKRQGVWAVMGEPRRAFIPTLRR